MKRCLFILLVVINQQVFAQPAVKLYGYSQEIYPGMVPQRDIPTENGDTIQKKPQGYLNYFFYLSMPAGTKLTPLRIYIKGQWYDIKKWDRITTPVIREMPVKKTLVAATKQHVIQLQNGDSVSIKKPAASLKKMMSQSQVIVSYKWKGVVYYTALRKITVLERVHAP